MRNISFVLSLISLSALAVFAQAEEDATLKTRAEEFLKACEAASPEHRNFINCSCGRDYVLDYPSRLVAAREKKSGEFRDRAERYKVKMIKENGEEIMEDVAPYCPLLSRVKAKEDLSEEEKQQFITLHGSLKKSTGAAASAYCGSMARAERELKLPDPPLPKLQFFWRNATLHKPCKNIGEYEAHLLKDIPPKPENTSLEQTEIPIKFTRVMRSYNGHQTLNLTYVATTDLDAAAIEKHRDKVFLRSPGRAIRGNFRYDWENKTVIRSMEIEMQQHIEKALQQHAPGHHIYDLKLKDVVWSD
ncbi:hypothetical protein [Emcibacter sp.]|uniref:hypothetical protein n=1 Tax=Emcibacter sp. TaxID=1979954 RepID=UPI003A8DC88F